MLLDVQTISKQIIKPSSPTPQHSNTTQLSSLDQAAPQIYIHVILLYTTTNSLDQIPRELKASLSQTLTRFYPLAGRIKLSPSNTLHVDCNDEGVEFIESRTESDFDSFLLEPPIDQLDKLLPVKATEFRWVEDPLLAVQLSMFCSGKGLALGISMSHLIADGASMALFLNCWADIARGINLNMLRTPQFNAAAAFPPQTKLANRPLPDYGTRDDNVAIKRFLVSGDAMRRLREGGCSRVQAAPTRVEAVSELVWRCLNRMRQDAAGGMMTSVNVRRKMPSLSSSSSSVQLSDDSFGNLWVGVAAAAAAEGSVRSAVRRVDEGDVRRRERTGWEGDQDVHVSWIFSSWCRLGLWRSDFGWGKPVWVGCGIRDMKDVCILIDARDGDGVEVWLWLERVEMERLERDQEFLQFASC